MKIKITEKEIMKIFPLIVFFDLIPFLIILSMIFIPRIYNSVKNWELLLTVGYIFVGFNFAFFLFSIVFFDFENNEIKKE